MKAIFIYNPNSGKKTRKKLKEVTDFSKIADIFHKYHYEVEFIETKYQSHAKEIVANLDKVDLVVSLGGDGTFNEIVAGNFKRKEKLVVTHLPYGTTNDIGTMFGLGKNIYKNLDLLLSGEVKNLDICFINNRPFVYVAGFGKFMNIAYDTKRNLKKNLGYFAYILNAIRDFLFDKTPLYEIEYEVNGEIYHGLYSFILVSNANRIAGINNFYKTDVKLNDGNCEVLFCNLRTKKEILKSLIYLRKHDFKNVPGFYFHQTNNIKIKFIDKLKNTWCLDGEKFDSIPDTYDIVVTKDLKMLIPKKIIPDLLVGDKK